MTSFWDKVAIFFLKGTNEIGNLTGFIGSTGLGPV